MQSFSEAQSPEEKISKKKRLKKYLLSGLAAGAVIGGSAYALRKRKNKRTLVTSENSQRTNVGDKKATTYKKESARTGNAFRRDYGLIDFMN